MTNATLTKPAYEEELFTEDEEYKPVPIFDKYGNPTPETLEAFYESEHGLTEPVTFEELIAWANEDN